MKQYYTTKDFQLSAFLLSQGCKLLTHSKEKSVTTFIFKNDSETERFINDYFNLNATVEPMAYANSQRALRSILNSDIN